MNRLLSFSLALLSLLYVGCSSREPVQPPDAGITKSWTEPTTANASAEGRSVNYEVALVVDMNQMGTDSSAAWLGYLMGRNLWIGDHLVEATPADFRNYTPTLGEELAGRKTLAELWKSLRAKSGAKDTYLDSLVMIDDAGYIEPYVWQYHAQSSWGPRPGDLPWVGFGQWMDQRLPDFTPVTQGSIKLLPPGATVQAVKNAKPDSIQAAN